VLANVGNQLDQAPMYASDTISVGEEGVRGWTVQTENNIYGAGSFKWNPPGSAWYAQHYWEH